MKKKLLITLVSMAVTLPMPTSATTTFGRPDCSEWVSAQGKKTSYKRWMLGYVSGISVTMDHMMRSRKKKELDILDSISSADQIYLWTDNYCKKNPLNTLFDAGLDFMVELGNNRKK